ncbi:MAG: hypothetical protein HPY50_22250 [Firmicutes bacterium]|nr:hypothetical protein [Bacillota bacterium]
MAKKRDFFIFACVFVLTVILVFGAGYYRKGVSKEAGRFSLEVVSDEAVSKFSPAAYDLQNEVTPEGMARADIVSFSTGYGSEVVNRSEKPLWLAVRVTGIGGAVRVLSSNPGFDEKTGLWAQPLMPGESLPVSIGMEFPAEVLDRYLVGKGAIQFFDYLSSRDLGEVPLKVINSKPRKSCCSPDNSGK